MAEPSEYVLKATSRVATTYLMSSERIELAKAAVAALEAAGYVLVPSGGEVEATAVVKPVEAT